MIHNSNMPEHLNRKPFLLKRFQRNVTFIIRAKARVRALGLVLRAVKMH